MNDLIGNKQSKIMLVPLKAMTTSDRIQRELKENRVDHLLAAFDPDHFGLPVLTQREDKFFIIDGQHRVEAVKRWLGVSWVEQSVECRVYTNLNEVEEAEMFLRLNDILAVGAFDKFKNGVNALHAEELHISGIVNSEGLSIGKHKKPGNITAVKTLRNIYLNHGGEQILAKTLRTLRDAYGDSGFEASVMKGIAQLFKRYSELDERLVMVRIRDMHGGVKGLLSQANVLHKQTSNSLASCVAAAAVEVINQGRGNPKLISWWKSSTPFQSSIMQ
jgi:hypothetical protein